jgi:imidazolonepropionase
LSVAARLFVNIGQVVTCAGPPRSRRGKEMHDAHVRTAVAVAVRGERIEAIGAEPELRAQYPDADVTDCARGVLTPGLVDSHTHAVFGRARYEEQELRAAGLPYMEIARRGGGIHASVRDFRTRSEDQLFDLARSRLVRLAAYGTTTVEVKSGYGLSLEEELKALRVIARLADDLPLRVVATWLGAHEIPLEFRERESGRREYLDLLISDVLPVVARERLAVFADVFCEPGVFTTDESRRLLEAAARPGSR